MLRDWEDMAGWSVLEPSCGDGRILDVPAAKGPMLSASKLTSSAPRQREQRATVSRGAISSSSVPRRQIASI